MKIRPLRTDDAEQAFQLRVAAFSAVTRDDYDADEVYIPDHHRLVAVDGRRMVGHAGAWPFRQAFGGHPVPMGGLAGVVVVDDRRGTGIGSQLLSAALDHMGDAGMVISTLYPSTPLPYRRWGWEFAGVHARGTLRTRDLLDVPAPTSGIVLRPYTPADLAPIVAVHDGVTRTEPGGLVAGERWLRRALRPDPDEPEIVIVATRGDDPVGLLLLAKTQPTEGHGSYGLDVRRLFGVDRDVERVLWRAVGYHHPVAARTSFVTRPAEPLLFDLQHGLDVSGALTMRFMTRLVDAPAAISARGWPAISATVELEIVDARRPANAGRFVFEVRDGAAALTAGGSGRVAIDIGALSSLYTGFASARQLAHAHRLTGATDADIVALSDAFNAQTPFLRDYF